MTTDELINALEHMESETGSLADYIDRDALIEWLKRIPIIDLSDGRGLCRVIMEDDFKKAIKKMPKGIIADVAPVRHGWWIPEEHEDRVSPTMTHRYRWYHCSLCGRRLIGFSNPKDAPYCHCGAKMDGGGDHA